MAKLLMAAANAAGRSSSALERMQQPIINRSVDISLARRALGFAPSPLVESIDATIDWARRAGQL
jgi:nucleoside-diphosphate-sugar epimerase